MNKQFKLLSAILVVSGVLSILYSILEPEKVKTLNTWYYILREKRSDYDFRATIERSKRVYYYFTAISATGIIVSTINQGAGEGFVWLCLISLAIAQYYLHPVKVK